MRPTLRLAFALPIALLSIGTLPIEITQAAQPPSNDSTPDTTGIAQRELYKNVVFAFYKAVADANFDQARQYIGDYYIEHDPERQDGLPGLQRALDYNRRHQIRTSIIHELVIVDGDYVVLYSHRALVRSPPSDTATSSNSPRPAASDPPRGGVPPPQYTSTADIFRLSSGKIVEHWNTVQE